MPPTSAASRAVATRAAPASNASSASGYELSANWGAIIVTLCALPWVALFTLNPISLFFIGFWAIALIFITFLPKLLHFVLLELAIAQGRWSEFYERNHAQRIRGALPAFSVSLAYAEALTAELSMRVGAPDAVAQVALKEVAVARKKYSGHREGVWLPSGAISDRLMRLPWQVVVRFKDHGTACATQSTHTVLRFVALNVVARLYTKNPI
jgi:hypothetical protein